MLTRNHMIDLEWKRIEFLWHLAVLAARRRPLPDPPGAAPERVCRARVVWLLEKRTDRERRRAASEHPAIHEWRKFPPAGKQSNSTACTFTLARRTPVRTIPWQLSCRRSRRMCCPPSLRFAPAPTFE
jgi:hypothetical protein